MTEKSTKARKTKAATMKKTSTAIDAARDEGVLDERLLELDPARWPIWARARYGVDEPVADLVDPLRVEEAQR